jgi:hypothetical protein
MQDIEGEVVGLTIMKLCVICAELGWTKKQLVGAISFGWDKVDSYPDIKVIDSMIGDRYSEFVESLECY